MWTCVFWGGNISLDPWKAARKKAALSRWSSRLTVASRPPTCAGSLDPEVVGTGKWPEGPGRGGGCEVSWLPIVSGFHQCLSSYP